MQHIESGQSGGGLSKFVFKNTAVRFVFKNTVVSFALAADATLWDVAQTMVKVSKRRHQTPDAIYVTLSRASRPSRLRAV